MCQEHDCDCCTDEWPEDACDCVECYHGVEDISVIQRDPCIEDRRLDVVEQLCNRFKNLNSSSGASTSQPLQKDSPNCCQGETSQCCSNTSNTTASQCSSADKDSNAADTLSTKCCSEAEDSGTADTPTSKCCSEGKDTGISDTSTSESCSEDKDTTLLDSSTSKCCSECQDSNLSVTSSTKCCSEGEDSGSSNTSTSKCCSEGKDTGISDTSTSQRCSEDKVTTLSDSSASKCCSEGKDSNISDTSSTKCCPEGKDTDISDISSSTFCYESKETNPPDTCTSKCCSEDKNYNKGDTSSTECCSEGEDNGISDPSASKCCSKDKTTDAVDSPPCNKGAKDCSQDSVSETKCCSKSADSSLKHPRLVTCESRGLASAVPCCNDESCYENADESSLLLAPAKHGTHHERSYGTSHVPDTCLATDDECCQSQSCKKDDEECDSEGDGSSKVGSWAGSVSRISITECSGFYPILLNLPQTPGVNTAGGSQNKPLQHTTKLRVHNICCALESKLVQETLEPLEGVTSIAVNVIGRVAYVRHDPEVTTASELISALNRLHLGASIMETGSRQSDGKSDSLPPLLSSCFIYLLIQTVLLLIAVVAHFVKGASWYKWVAIAEIVVGIGPVLKKAFLSIKILSLDINILMLIAIVGTLAINDWLEGAGVVYVFTFAETLQEFCMHKVQRTISGLMLKAPQVAILASTGECIRVEEVALGTVIAIRPGELIPLDGKVLAGRASVDESSVSGESVPVEKTVGAKVYSGTVNQNGYLEVETTSDSTSSTVTKVAELVQEAQTGSANTELAINWFAKYYTPAVVIAAVLVIVIPAILGAAGVGSYSNEIKEWGRRALVLLVIACPCALVMATPIAVVCGITAAARKGSLIKGGVHLETLARLEVLAFDKTGTLTEGKFQVVDVECAFGVEEEATLRLAAALESKSSHPLAAAVVNKFSGCVAEMLTSESPSLPEVSRFQLHEGQGISGNVDGHVVQIGNREFLHRISANPLTASMEDNYISWSNESKTVIFVCVDNKLAMMISLADTVRPNSLLALDWLKKLRIQSAMITGDNSRTAMAVKARLGLDEFVAEMKPENKLKWITDRQAGVTDDDYDGKIECEQPERPCLPSWTSCRQYKFLASRDKKKGIVGMVGDGVNDGPALAAANIGIAMGAGGTALAVEAADVALMSNNLSKIPELVELGRFCRLVVAENIAFSVILKLGIVIATLAGKTALWMAVVADVLGLLFVLLNGLRPLWWKVDGKRTFKKTQNEIPLNLNSEQDYSYGVSV